MPTEKNGAFPILNIKDAEPVSKLSEKMRDSNADLEIFGVIFGVRDGRVRVRACVRACGVRPRVRASVGPYATSEKKLRENTA